MDELIAGSPPEVSEATIIQRGLGNLTGLPCLESFVLHMPNMPGSASHTRHDGRIIPESTTPHRTLSRSGLCGILGSSEAGDYTAGRRRAPLTYIPCQYSQEVALLRPQGLLAKQNSWLNTEQL
jgi:hypothetical protein